MMTKYQCACGDFFYGSDNHFDYADNTCESCEQKDGYVEVDKRNYTLHDYAIMLDNELEDANFHSMCGVGERIEDVISLHVVNQQLAKTLMEKLCEAIYEMI